MMDVISIVDDFQWAFEWLEKPIKSAKKNLYYGSAYHAASQRLQDQRKILFDSLMCQKPRKPIAYLKNPC